jgi:rubrerythrin
MSANPSSTLSNVADAFSRDAQRLVRYRRFASTARHEAQLGAAALFERLAQNQLVLVDGHLDFLRGSTDPLSSLSFGTTKDNLRAALLGEHEEIEGLYLSAIRVAGSEDYPSIASWFQSSVLLKRLHIARIEEELGDAARSTGSVRSRSS